MAYDVDMRDMKFQLFEWLPTTELLEGERFSQWDRSDVEMVLEEALKLAQEQLAPSNAEGDRSAPARRTAAVTMPPSFKPVYEKICEGDWIGCINNPEFGGMGLPEVVGTAHQRVLLRRQHVALPDHPAHPRRRVPDRELRHRRDEASSSARSMYSGEWAGTMCLTEPQAGSDVGASKTKRGQAGRRHAT